MARYKYRRKDGVLRREHDIIWETENGMKIPEGYVIHHKDGNGKNNKLENLELLTRKEHRALHARLKREGCDVVDPNDPDVIADREKCRRYTQNHHDEIVERRKLHKAERDAYNRQYHLEHKDEINARHRKYNKEHGDVKRIWKEKNRERIAQQDKQYRLDHADEIRAYAAKYRKENPEKIREYQRQYRLKNIELFRARDALNAAIKRNAPSTLISKLKNRYDLARSKKM